MGLLGKDYTLRPGHAIFFLLVASSVILGFSYLSEMYQRIQLQEKLERQTQHIAAERSVIQHKATLLQTQIENRNKEMKRLQDIHTIQIDEQRSICEKERADLLNSLSTKDDETAELQSEYESLKQRFEHLMSVMNQFEKNQSRLLEKFSTQSTQCMNVINKLSELCSKGKGILVQKTAQVTQLNETSVNGKGAQSNTSTIPQDFNRINMMQMTVLLSSSTPTKATTLDLDHGKQSSLKATQKLQQQVSVINSTTSTKDNEDELIEYENSTEENKVLESQTEMGEKDNKTSAKKELPKNMLLKEIKSQTQATKLAEENETPFDLNEVSESETPSVTMGKKVNNFQNPNIVKNEYMLTNQDGKTAVGVIYTKELTGKLKENITKEVDTKREGKAYSTGKNLEDQRKPQRLTLEKVKTQDRDIYKAIGEFEYENNTEDMELNDQEISRDNIINV